MSESEVMRKLIEKGIPSYKMDGVIVVYAEELIEEIQRVEELKRYVKHKAGCQAPFMPYKKPNPCTCELDSILND